MSADREKVILDNKKDGMAIALRQRITAHQSYRIQCDVRVFACQEIIQRDPGSRAALEPTIQVWHRIRAYHMRAIDECMRVMMDLGINIEG